MYMRVQSIKYIVLSIKPRSVCTLYLLLNTLYFFIGNVNAQTSLNLKFYIEGYYLSGGMMQQVLHNEGVDPNPFSTLVDTAVVELHDSIYPCSDVMTYKGVFKTDGTMQCNF